MNVLHILEQKIIIFYALGALKNVGFEAISNIVKERKKMVNLNLFLIL